ncbi:MAG: DUF642 domain-containing protein [Pseudomonadota bacterium]
MLTKIRMLAGAATLLCASFSSQAGLIVNGDFESHGVKSGNWAWMSSNVFEGWQGSNIEVWNAMNGVFAASGSHFIELNAHGANQGSWSIFQLFETEIGREYELSFFYRARANNNEQFQVAAADINWLLNDHTTKSWNQFTQRFVATDTTTKLQFTSLNSGTVGNFLDAIQVTALPAVQAVPAPASLAAFGLGLVLLAAGRRKRRQH